MGQLGKSHMIETVVWSLIAVIFFGYTFEFNQPIEIYKFGATGWPRVIILLLMLVTLGNLYHHFKHGSAIQKGRVGIAETDDSPTDYSNPATLAKIIAILFTPFLIVDKRAYVTCFIHHRHDDRNLQIRRSCAVARL